MPKPLLTLIPAALKAVQIRPEPDRIIILTASVITDPTCCPGCGAVSTSIHGRYHRTLADLPWQGRQVQLKVEVRRLACHNQGCPRRTFAELMLDVARPFTYSSAGMSDAVEFPFFSGNWRPAAALLHALYCSRGSRLG